MQEIKLIHRAPAVAGEAGRQENRAARPFGVAAAKIARAYHQSFPGYEPTPLVPLKGLARELGIAGIYVKDESYRFGLNAFKALGGSFCLGKYIAGRLGKEITEIDQALLTAPETREKTGELLFVTATDGNHGRGVAWTAKMLGQKAVVLMPKGSAPERLDNIRALGAEAWITDRNYDESVELAAQYAAEHGGVLVQDTAWDGYEEMPLWIMQGYTTMALEAVEQLVGEKPEAGAQLAAGPAGGVRPTHVFLQAGVGAMAGAVTGFLADYYGDAKPVISIVEPDQADCVFRTAEAADGRIHTVGGDLATIMAGLACGVPCSLGWRVLDRYAENFFSVPDRVAAEGMRILGRPRPGDPRVVSGESGAVTTGLLYQLMRDPQLAAMRDKLGLDRDAVVLLISTEGDTDRENYRRILQAK